MKNQNRICKLLEVRLTDASPDLLRWEITPQFINAAKSWQNMAAQGMLMVSILSLLEGDPPHHRECDGLFCQMGMWHYFPYLLPPAKLWRAVCVAEYLVISM